MVFELVTQGEILNIPTDNPLSEERAWFIFRQVILGMCESKNNFLKVLMEIFSFISIGVEYLFLNRIIHGDIKPNNLLLADGDIVKVADLGVCNEFLGDDAQIDLRTISTTPAFRSPETLLAGHYYFDGKKADIW